MRDAPPTDAELDEAAGQLAACLMRLCEALEHRDAMQAYSPFPERRLDWISPRVQRRNLLNRFYREWFRNHARP